MQFFDIKPTYNHQFFIPYGTQLNSQKNYVRTVDWVAEALAHSPLEPFLLSRRSCRLRSSEPKTDAVSE